MQLYWSIYSELRVLKYDTRYLYNKYKYLEYEYKQYYMLSFSLYAYGAKIECIVAEDGDGGEQ